ncbi:helix-turn-helix transcriptional regulator [Actinomadura viridis]|uniref:Transcriptional regulator with XRE-family HTH domain n=1 Tax=Actinomadura viridis TaxID=58110 RepID=A0A931GHL0_9ACTN|nr:Scr1 family TA system antitoxin-like transcriptional regulator [Actinomadura viridis]MBG6087002.1 transcriptional regulator with XRE-family HTH domain [Actinomadura viridis]
MGEERLREIGRELRRLRTAAGLSGVGLASRAGVPQPTVSRVETGRRVSDPGVVLRLFGALGLDAAEVDRLGGLVNEAYAESVPRRVDAGVSFRPGAGVELGRAARALRVFESTVVPELLRTAEYGAAAGKRAGAEADRAAVLVDGDRRFTFVLAEAVLRTWPGSGKCMSGQLAYLLTASERPNVRLGVLPGSVLLGWVAVPLHGFTVYDEAAVTVETFTRELTLTDAEEVRAYAEVFEGFERAAVFGDRARDLVKRAADDLDEVLESIH